MERWLQRSLLKPSLWPKLCILPWSTQDKTYYLDGNLLSDTLGYTISIWWLKINNNLQVLHCSLCTAEYHCREQHEELMSFRKEFPAAENIYFYSWSFLNGKYFYRGVIWDSIVWRRGQKWIRAIEIKWNIRVKYFYWTKLSFHTCCCLRYFFLLYY